MTNRFAIRVNDKDNRKGGLEYKKTLGSLDMILKEVNWNLILVLADNGSITKEGDFYKMVYWATVGQECHKVTWLWFDW